MTAAELQAAGFSETEASEYEKLKNGGFSDDEIAKYMQEKEKSPAGAWPEKVAEFVKETAQNIPGSAIRVGKGLVDVVRMIVPSPEAKIPIPGVELGRNIGQLVGGLAAANIRGIAPTAIGKEVGPGEAAARQMILEPIQKFIQETAERPMSAVEKGLEYIKKEPVEAALNILPFSTAAKTAKTASEVAKVKNIKHHVNLGFTKGITARMETAKTYKGTQAYLDRAADSTVDIAKNKGKLKLVNRHGEEVTGRVPRNLAEHVQALGQRMTDIYKAYTDIAKAAGEQGTVINLDRIQRKLLEIAEDPVIRDVRPEVARYAAQRAKKFAPPEGMELKTYTPMQMQEAIKLYNTALKAYQKSSHPAYVGRADIEAEILRMMRRDLDDAIESATGAHYQELKNIYAAHKTIEKDLVNKFKAELPKDATRELFNATDIYSLGEALTGIVTLHPLMIAKASSFYAAKNFIKHFWGVDKRIETMFKNVDRLVNEPEKAITPMRALKVTAGPAAMAGRTKIFDSDFEDKMKKWLEENKE